MTTTSTNITTISRDDTYHGWPTIGRMADGTLLVVSSSGREAHVCPFGKVRLQRSVDQGQSWSEPQVLIDGPLDDRDAGILVTSKGTIIVTWFTSLAWMQTLYRQEAGVSDWLIPEKIAQWQSQRDRLIHTPNYLEHHGEWLIRSTDGGKTWSKPIRVGVSSPHGPTEMGNGNLLFLGKPTADHQAWERGNTFSKTPVTASISTDDGLTWTQVGSVPCADGDTNEHYHEPHALQAADGRIIGHIRSHNQTGKRNTLASESVDGGKTWSSPRLLAFGDLAHPSHLLRLPDGRIVATFGYREKPFGNRVSISEDHGQTWSKPIIISDDGNTTDLGYPSTVALDDTNMLTVWYEKVDGIDKAILRQASWQL